MIFYKITFISYINLRYLLIQKIYYYIYIYIFLILINIYVYCIIFLNYLTKINFLSFCKKKNIKLLTIQRAPMAHRRWSQEQYKIIIFYWINIITFQLNYKWINYIYKNLTFFFNFIKNLTFLITTSVLLLKTFQLKIQILYILYY